MRDPLIKDTILERMYEEYFNDRSMSNLPKIQHEFGWDENSFAGVVDWMVNDGLIRPLVSGGNYGITAFGILYAEANGVASEELKTQNSKMRTTIMSTLAEAYEKSGSGGLVHIDDLVREAGRSQRAVNLNLQLLQNDLVGYAEAVTMLLSRTTQRGLDAVEEWQKKSNLADELDRVAQLDPRNRGRSLQKLFAAAVEHHGWSQEEGVRTSNEEMDVILYKNREYYLVECKWEKDPAEAGVIRELHGKLSNRAGVRGIVVAMTGFTKGAKEQTETYANSHLILLFGPEDTRALVNSEIQFEELLNEKYKQLVTRRNAVFS